MGKRCTKCGLEKSVSAFAKNSSRKDGLQGWCRACIGAHNAATGYSTKYYLALKDKDPARIQQAQRRTRLKNRYGLTEDDFDRLVKEQDGKCAVCHRTPAYRLFVDHDHATGHVRGLLCSKCNGALGWLENNRDRISVYLGLDSRWLSKKDSHPTSISD